MKILTTAIIKGGTGKTTTAAALAQAAAARGQLVLAIDLDPQGNLSAFLGADTALPGSYDLLHGKQAEEVLQRTEQAGIVCIAASPDLATERTTPASAMRLKNALAPIQGKFDLAIVDCPPLMGEVTYNALFACDLLIIPVETDQSSLHGLYQVTSIARQIQERSNQAMKVCSVITRYDGRSKLNRYLKDMVESQAKELGVPVLSVIRSGVAIREAQALRKSLYDYAPQSNPAADYMTLYNQIKTVIGEE